MPIKHLLMLIAICGVIYLIASCSCEVEEKEKKPRANDATEWQKLDITTRRGEIIHYKLITINDHNYLIFMGGPMLAVTHDPDCPHPSHKKQE